MAGTEPFPAVDDRRTTRKRMQSSQLMRDAGEEFLAEALAQAYQDLDEAESHIERLEDALHTVEDECARIAEDRQEMLGRIGELTTQVQALQGQPVQAAPPAVPTVAQPVAQPPVLAPQPRISIRQTLDRVSQWMWDEPPDEMDEHIARSLRSRWRAGFVLACLVALVGLAGLAVAVGIPEVQGNLEAKTAVMEAPEHYSTSPLLEEKR